MNDTTDISHAKIVIGGGGNSPGKADKIIDLAAATSVDPADGVNYRYFDEKSQAGAGNDSHVGKK
jgi:ABC-type Zn uptake system ZnuABC Zn-binding protein ZnuA